MSIESTARMFASQSEILWLSEQLDRYKISQRHLAKSLDLDPSSLNRALAGKRKVSRVEFSKALAFLETVVPRQTNSLAKAAWDSRLTSGEIALRSNLEPERVLNILSGVGAEPTNWELRQIGEGLRVGVEHLYAYNDAVPTLAPAAHAGRHNRYDDANHRDTGTPPAALIEVYAAPRPIGGVIFSKRGELIERRPRPAPLDTTSSYGLFVSEDMLYPRYLSGEILLVHPGKPFVAGRWVVVELDDGNLAIGELRASNADFIEVAAAGSSETTRLGRMEITAISPIVGTWSY